MRVEDRTPGTKAFNCLAKGVTRAQKQTLESVTKHTK
jgi:hypothetical protein